MIRLIDNYPSFVNEEQNIGLMDKVTLEEVNEVVNSMQKDKSP